jgi:hypothetical protein
MAALTTACLELVLAQNRQPGRHHEAAFVCAGTPCHPNLVTTK